MFLNHAGLSLAERCAAGYGSEAAYYRDLLAGMMLRRSKEEVQSQVHLPPCTWTDVPVLLSLPERSM